MVNKERPCPQERTMLAKGTLLNLLLTLGIMTNASCFLMNLRPQLDVADYRGDGIINVPVWRYRPDTNGHVSEQPWFLVVAYTPGPDINHIQGTATPK